MSKMNYTKMNEKDWKIVRTLRDNGCSIKQVTEITGRASGTQNTIMRSTDFADYQRLASLNSRRWNSIYKPGGHLYKPTEEETAAAADTEEVPQPSEPTEPSQIAKTATEVSLSRIADALERLADAWENAPSEPTKRGIFSR